MARFTAALLALSIAVLLSGCTQGGSPSVCSSGKPAMFANCVYINAVMEQNPFYCYSLEDKYQRGVCIQDASDAAKKTLLERADPATRDAIFAEKSATQPAPPMQENATPTEQPPVVVPQEGCGSLQDAAKDNCYRALAVEKSNISTCEQVLSPVVRENCIAQEAQAVKKPEICPSLTNQSSIDLCNFYSKTGVS
jgi:hypothetical protein